MNRGKDYTGEKFYHLTAIKRTGTQIAPSGDKKAIWLFQCDCENNTLIEAVASNVVRGHTQSCGCHKEKIDKERGQKLKKYNKYDLTGEYGIGWTNGSNPVAFKFDLEDYEKISKYTWGIDGCGYISTDNRRNDCPYLKLHQYIMGFTWVDHINRDKTDNRKQNLRKTDSELNKRNQSKYKNNTSGFIGVNKKKNGHGNKFRWVSSIRINKKHKQLGTFATLEEALAVRLQAEYDIYKPEWAPQRHLFSEYNIPNPKLHQYLKDKGIFEKLEQ